MAWRSLHGVSTSYRARIRADSDRVYQSIVFHHLCTDMGLVPEYSAPYRHRQLKMERMWAILGDKALAMAIHAGIPMYLWATTYHIVAHVHNNLYSSVIAGGKLGVPITLVYGREPDTARLRVYGCACFPHTPPEKRALKKMTPKATTQIFVGYSSDSYGYRMYNPTTRQITTSESIVFHEDTFPFRIALGDSDPFSLVFLRSSALDPTSTTVPSPDVATSSSMSSQEINVEDSTHVPPESDINDISSKDLASSVNNHDTS